MVGGAVGFVRRLTCGILLVEVLEKNALLQSPHRIEELVKIFIHATKVRGPDEPYNRSYLHALTY